METFKKVFKVITKISILIIVLVVVYIVIWYTVLYFDRKAERPIISKDYQTINYKGKVYVPYFGEISLGLNEKSGTIPGGQSLLIRLLEPDIIQEYVGVDCLYLQNGHGIEYEIYCVEGFEQSINNASSENEAHDTIYEDVVFKDLVNPKIIEENKYYKVYTSDNLKSYYYLYDDKGDIIKEGGYDTRIPSITMKNNNIVRFRIQSGTGSSTALSIYYDTKNDVLSKDYYCVLDDNYDLLIYCDRQKLVVQNIFAENKFYKEITEFKKPLAQKTVEPFINAKIINKNQILVTYITEDNEEITETIDLN